VFHTFSGYAYLMTRAPCCSRSYSSRSLDCNYEAPRLCNNIMLSAFDHSCAILPCNNAARLEKRKVDYDPITKYSVQWFINNSSQKPKTATCLFYTRGLSRTAYIYAKTKAHSPMTTIWVRQQQIVASECCGPNIGCLARRLLQQKNHQNQPSAPHHAG
jgi:hypothetical protein